MVSADDDGNWGRFTPLYFMQTSSSAEIAVASSNKTLYIGFGGSDENDDWWDNFEYDLVEPDRKYGNFKGKIHEGWYEKFFLDEEFEEIDFFIKEEILPVAFKNKMTIVFTGHSQGGALATLYGAYMADYLPKKKMLISVAGSPRVGNAQFKADVNTRLTNLAIYRVVNEDDLVPRVPLRSMDYRHVGHLLLYRNNIFKAYYNQYGNANTYAGVSDDDWDMEGGVWSRVEDHNNDNYRKILRGAVRYPSRWPNDFERVEQIQDSAVVESEPECCFYVFRCWRWCEP